MKRRFAALGPPTRSVDGIVYAVDRLLEQPAVYLGRSPDGNPVLLAESAQALVAPMNLSHLKVFYSPMCHVQLDGSTQTLGLTAVELNSREPSLVSLFLSTMAAILDSEIRAEVDVIGAVGLLVELFREVNAPPRSAVVGIWGELLAISDCADPELAVRAWHDAVDERFDLALGDERIEIKTTLSDRRTHQFTHAQLRSAPTRTLVVSTLTISAAGGVTVGELSDRILGAVAENPELVAKVLRQIASALGREWGRAMDQGFDETIARSTRRLYLASDLPAMPDPPPPEISQISYVVDLTDAPVAALKTLDGARLWSEFATDSGAQSA